MQDTQKIRFVAANFSVLQGLKAVPLGLLLILTILWANSQTGPASDLTLPIIFSIGTLALYWLIIRYYNSRFGKVQGLPKQKWVEYAFGIIGGALALGAFIVDTSYHLPFSCIGLMFALSIPAEYVRSILFARGNYLLAPAVIAFIIQLAASILPLLGFDGWWLALGIRAQLFGVLLVAGVVVVAWGFYYHWFLIRQLAGEGK